MPENPIGILTDKAAEKVRDLSGNKLTGSKMPLDPTINLPKSPTYSIIGRESNWWKSLPYAFKAKFGGQTRVFYLPINPSNLTITTHYATNFIPTLYGTVEEHSEVRYFDIVIAGTTGFAPKYTESAADSNSIQLQGNAGRAAYQSGEVFANLAGGFFKQTLGRLDSALNSAADAVNSFSGKTNKFQAGVNSGTSGYVAFHNLYNFLLEYKKKAAAGTSKSSNTGGILDKFQPSNFVGPPSLATLTAIATGQSSDNMESPLSFVNYKDNNQYSVVVNGFTLERSAENPMLYNYRIVMRGYNLQGLNGTQSYDGVMQARLAALGLNTDGPSIASRFKGGVKSARNATNALKGALGSIGLRR